MLEDLQKAGNGKSITFEEFVETITQRLGDNKSEEGI